MDEFTQRSKSAGPGVSSDYRALHEYLKGRFADAVVLTFVQIEDLLGHALPREAYSNRTWWDTGSDVEALSPQSTAWVRAERTSTANLGARTVRFERSRP